MGDDGGLERHHRAALIERLVKFGAEGEWVRQSALALFPLAPTHVGEREG
jgi:hypothetical protein